MAINKLVSMAINKALDEHVSHVNILRILNLLFEGQTKSHKI